MIADPPPKKSGFAGDVMKLASGTVFAQMISLLTAPVIARLYAPEAFGILALLTSITGIIGVIACMRYELAIMLPKNDEEAANLLGLSLSAVFIVTLVSALLLWLGQRPLLNWLNAPYMAHYLWIIPLSIFIGGIFAALNYWNSRTRHFGRLSIARIISSLTTAPLTIAFGLAGFATPGVMIGTGIAGQCLATAVLGGQIWKDDRKMLLKVVRWYRMKEGLFRYKKFPLMTTWSAFMNNLSSNLPALMLTAFFTSSVVGYFSLGQRLLTIPMSLIGGAVAQVFFQRTATARYDGTLPIVVGKTFMRLVAIGFFPLIIVMISGQDLFIVIFGNQWSNAGIYAQILAPWIMFQFISSPLSTLFSVLEIQEIGLVFNVILLITRIAALTIGGLMGSVLTALILFSASGTLLYLCLCLIILKKSGVIMSMIAKDTLKISLIIIIALLPVSIFKTIGSQPMIILVTGCLCLPLYYSALCCFDEELQRLLAGLMG